MSEDRQQDLLSALVILRPAGEEPTMDALTADRVHRLVPSPDVVRTVNRWFTARGFEVGDAVGISFALTGPRSLFADTFGLREGAPRPEARNADAPDADAPYTLNADALPGDVARYISEITFPAPPDFGPPHP
ncbi:hypothetical protein P1P68_25705 [Streptomyces scabiei]|uniref:hypothetical protein n=1 Tax=Streptomyces scabiei TaxID=1930 RepID=UPI0029907E57|nr:hypothetical protein [Streptomyces scabiei]MDW8808087.1 hypothetical protein [Streptomyces scabiei]